MKLYRFVKPVPLVLTANTAPWPEAPPTNVAPYRVLPDKTNAPNGRAPSLLPYGGEPEVAVKLCRFVRPVPSVLMANIVPLPELPPTDAVPYRVLPDKSKPEFGEAPSLLPYGGEPEVAVKLCRFVKPVPSVLTANTVPLPELPPAPAVPYSVLPDKSNLEFGRAPSLLPYGG